MEPAIRVENLGKLYRVTNRGERANYATLRETVMHAAGAPLRWARQGFAKPDPAEDFWALKGVDFEVMPGEVVGVIGRNGAGKSTLLKILSRITKPTTGRVTLNGRVGSLLEVGTGFHPELTGRENVYLNGSILGMSRREIAKKFDEIVAFAEVERFLDTPVKRYSSGMYVRLAFAVAAHLEPEILIVDEVLAVGDAGFQQKCLAKMRECASDGRTVLLVSHQMGSVRDLCTQAVWLAKGAVQAAGPMGQVVESYLSDAGAQASPGDWIDLSQAPRTGLGTIRLAAVRCFGSHVEAAPLPDGKFQLDVRLQVGPGAAGDIRVEFQLFDRFQTRLLVANTMEGQRPLLLSRGNSSVHFVIDRLHLCPGTYSVNLSIGNAYDYLDSISDAIRFEVFHDEHGPESWSTFSLVTRSFRYEVY